MTSPAPEARNWIQSHTVGYDDRASRHDDEQQQQARRECVRSIVTSALTVDEFLALVGNVPADPWRLLLRLAELADGATEIETTFATLGALCHGKNPKGNYTRPQLSRFSRHGSEVWQALAEWQDAEGWLLAEGELGGRDVDGCNVSSRFRLSFLDTLAEAYGTAQKDHRWKKGRRPEAIREALAERVGELRALDEFGEIRPTNTDRAGVLRTLHGKKERKPRRPAEVAVIAMSRVDHRDLTDDEARELREAWSELEARLPDPPDPGNGSKTTAAGSESSDRDKSPTPTKPEEEDSQGGSIEGNPEPYERSSFFKEHSQADPELDPENTRFSEYTFEDFPKENGKTGVLPAPFEHLSGDPSNGSATTAAPSDSSAVDRSSLRSREKNSEPEPPDGSILENSASPLSMALRAGESCLRHGSTRFGLSIKDDRAGRLARPYRVLDPDRFARELPELLAECERERLSLIARIVWADSPGSLLLRDDLTAAECQEWEDVGAFLSWESSPNRYSCLVSLADERDPEDLLAIATRLDDQARARGLSGNSGSFGSVRWPGSRNHKPERELEDGSAPLVRLRFVSMDRTVSLSALEAAGLLADPRSNDPSPPGCLPVFDADEWSGVEPSYSECEARAMDEHGKVDSSRADLKFCERCIEARMSDAMVVSRLLELSPKVRERSRASGHEYARDKVRDCRGWIERGKPRRRRTG